MEAADHETINLDNPLKTRLKEVKCVIWDLDNTLWDGVLLESDKVVLQDRIKEIIITLDGRGILHSIASKNNYLDAWTKLEEFGLASYFLYPEIHWDSKSGSVGRIVENLNIGKDTIVFIDDQPFERDEVTSEHPEVDVLDALFYLEMLDYKCLNPKFTTSDSARRRLMYQEEAKRVVEEQDYQGPKEEFLSSLNMVFSIAEAREEDLQRAEELTVRTNQLNATGKTYTYEELLSYAESKDHKLYVCELTDKYGSYGKIGLALVEMGKGDSYLKMLLMSCRVLSRSVGSVLMTYILKQSQARKKTLFADFKKTDRNRMMYVTYKFAGFQEVSNDGNGNIVFENHLENVGEFPDYIDVKTSESPTFA